MNNQNLSPRAISHCLVFKKEMQVGDFFVCLKVGDLGVVGLVFNLPSHHRVHHGANRFLSTCCEVNLSIAVEVEVAVGGWGLFFSSSDN